MEILRKNASVVSRQNSSETRFFDKVAGALLLLAWMHQSICKGVRGVGTPNVLPPSFSYLTFWCPKHFIKSEKLCIILLLNLIPCYTSTPQLSSVATSYEYLQNTYNNNCFTKYNTT